MRSILAACTLLLALAPAAGALAGASVWAYAGSYNAQRLAPSAECGGDVVLTIAETPHDPRGAASFVFESCGDPPVAFETERLSDSEWRLLLPDGAEVGTIGPSSSLFDGLPFAFDLPHGSFRGALDTIVL